jgi:glycosyltransferase involved in cell wall biosynthesis
MVTVEYSVGVWIPGDGMGNHAYHLVKGLERHNMLAHAFVMRYTGIKDGHHLEGGAHLESKIRELYFTEKIAYRFARYTHTDQYVIRDNLFDFWVSRQLGKASVFYGWTHHALWSLKKAKRLGKLTILERANSHPITYTRLLEAEYKKRGMRIKPYHPLIFKKHLQEIQKTDYIAITSQFTKQSLLENGVDEKRILLMPLGVDIDHFVPDLSKGESPPAPLYKRGECDDIFRVVYVGQICLRKGIPYLLEAWDKLQLKRAELLLVGDLVDEMQEILQRHLGHSTTITVLPHTKNPVSTYQQASVCILPTLEDGFGLVVLEAMACGVPVIVTEHTGAKDCVRPNVDGFVIPPYNADAIADTLLYCYRHRDQLKEMERNARQQAQQFSWTRYQDGVAMHLKKICHD